MFDSLVAEDPTVPPARPALPPLFLLPDRAHAHATPRHATVASASPASLHAPLPAPPPQSSLSAGPRRLLRSSLNGSAGPRRAASPVLPQRRAVPPPSVLPQRQCQPASRHLPFPSFSPALPLPPRPFTCAASSLSAGEEAPRSCATAMWSQEEEPHDEEPWEGGGKAGQRLTTSAGDALISMVIIKCCFPVASLLRETKIEVWVHVSIVTTAATCVQSGSRPKCKARLD